MKIKFTKLRLQANEKGLIVLNLPRPTILHIQSSEVWLTHSLSHQDYILSRGTSLSLKAGVILIEGTRGDTAIVDIQVQFTKLKAYFNHIYHGFKYLRRKAKAVSVCSTA